MGSMHSGRNRPNFAYEGTKHLGAALCRIAPLWGLIGPWATSARGAPYHAIRLHAPLVMSPKDYPSQLKPERMDIASCPLFWLLSTPQPKREQLGFLSYLCPTEVSPNELLMGESPGWKPTFWLVAETWLA